MSRSPSLTSELQEQTEAEPGADAADAGATRVLGSFAAYMRLVANEPSVGLYFIQEHVRKSVPFVIATKGRIRDTAKTAQMCKLDVDAGLDTMKLVRDVGSPALHRMSVAMASASRSLQRLKNGT